MLVLLIFRLKAITFKVKVKLSVTSVLTQRVWYSWLYSTLQV